MLVLTRRPGEQIVIGNDIRITVVSLGPGRVKIGIDAPASVRVDRQEIHQKIQQEQAEPAVASAADEPLVVGSAKLHNRIADKLPPAETVDVISQTPPPISRARLPRKPR